MIYEWDEAKRAANLAKHGVDFAAVRSFEWDTALRFPDRRKDYGEARWLLLGMICRRLHLLVFTEREDRVRVISLRKANQKERARYETEIDSQHA